MSDMKKFNVASLTMISSFWLNTTAKIHSILFSLLCHPGIDPGSRYLSGFLPSQE